VYLLLHLFVLQTTVAAAVAAAVAVAVIIAVAFAVNQCHSFSDRFYNFIFLVYFD